MSYRSAVVVGRWSPVSKSTMNGAAPAVPMWTRPPPSSRSWAGSCPGRTKLRGARAITSSTSARGKRSRPSPSSQPPAAVTSSTMDAVASAKPICSMTSRIVAWIRSISACVSGWYLPPIIPGQTGLRPSRFGRSRVIGVSPM